MSRLEGLAAPVLLTVVVGLLFGLTASKNAVSVDAHAAAVESWRIASSGTPWLDEIADSEEVAQNWFISEAPNGHVVAQRMAGPVMLGVPAYVVFHRDPDPGDFTLVPGAIAAALLTALSTVLLYMAVRQHTSQRLSLAVAGVFALATPTWSVSADALWTHTITQFGIAGAAYGASRRAWWLAGVFLGLGMLGRPHLALVAALLGLGVAFSRRDVRPALKVAVPTVTALGLLTVWNRWMFGVWGIEGAYVGRTTSALDGFEGSDEWASSAGPVVTELVNYLGFWVAPDRGFLIWSPAVLVLIPALVRSWRSQPAWSRWLLLGGALYTFVQLRLNYFAGGDSFWGYRHGLELLTCAVPALAMALPYAGRWARRALPIVLAAQFAAFALGATVTGYFVHIDQVWTDNSLWLLARKQPLVVAVWFALCIGVTVLAAVRFRLTTRWPDPARPVPSG